MPAGLEALFFNLGNDRAEFYPNKMGRAFQIWSEISAREALAEHASSIDHTGELIFTSSASPASRPPAPAPVFRRQGNARPRPRPPAPPWAFYSSSRVRRRPSSAAAEVTDNSVFDPTPNGESASGHRGHPYMTSAKFSRFWTPPVRIWD